MMPANMALVWQDNRNHTKAVPRHGPRRLNSARNYNVFQHLPDPSLRLRASKNTLDTSIAGTSSELEMYFFDQG